MCIAGCLYGVYTFGEMFDINRIVDCAILKYFTNYTVHLIMLLFFFFGKYI